MERPRGRDPKKVLLPKDEVAFRYRVGTLTKPKESKPGG